MKLKVAEGAEPQPPTEVGSTTSGSLPTLNLENQGSVCILEIPETGRKVCDL
jgi:hypothetical protein